MEAKTQRFGGIERLYGKGALAAFIQSHIVLIGLGGVGSWAAEALVRSGIGQITLIDLDDICITNTNRQLHALNKNIGKMKTQAMKERLAEINPECKIITIDDFFTIDSADIILNQSLKIDFVIDAIDSLNNKALLVQECLKRNIPLVVTGGAAGKIDFTKIKLADLGLAENDSLLALLRKKLRQEGIFPKIMGGGTRRKNNRPLLNVPCIYSDEEPIIPALEEGICKNLKLDCDTGMGSVSHITGAFGLMAAGVALNFLAIKN